MRRFPITAQLRLTYFDRWSRFSIISFVYQRNFKNAKNLYFFKNGKRKNDSSEYNDIQFIEYSIVFLS